MLILLLKQTLTHFSRLQHSRLVDANFIKSEYTCRRTQCPVLLLYSDTTDALRLLNCPMIMDDASADLILALQVQDLADLDDLATDHGGEEAAGDTSSDAHLARKLYREELRNNAAIISDLRFGEKVSEAAGDEPPSPCASATPTFDQVLVNSVGLLTIEASPTTEDKTSSFNHWGTGNYDCVICADEFPARHLITAPCGDYYCKNCTGRLYDLAMKDESLFPPRCCGKPIPLGIATPVLTAAQVQKFHEKRIEYNTQNRTYCHDTTCGAFVAPEKISGEKAMCTCGTMTCTVCKSAAHEDDCPKDPAYTSFVALAAAKGYQKCQQCKRLVELSLGCNHMT